MRVIVWVADAMRSQVCATHESLALLGPWLEQELAVQAAALNAAAEAKARRDALPVPTLREVLEALSRGERFSVSGGRWSETYFMEAGRLRHETFDEGFTDVRDGREDALAEPIGRYPDRFRKPGG